MTEVEIFAKCLSLGMTPAGAAGCTANIMAESAGRPNNVEDRSGIADETYTANVDNHSYGNFAGDAYGYGLCQWTSRDRKKALLDYAQGKGKSIENADMQLQFMAREMRQSYPYVWNILTSTDDPYKAGYEMCKRFEVPADTERQSQYRGNEARKIYERCAGNVPAVDPPAADDPAAPAVFWPPRMVDRNMNGADVTVLQAILVARGYTVNAVNGVFDGSTDKAVRQFQTASGLAADGVVGPLTWTALMGLSN